MAHYNEDPSSSAQAARRPVRYRIVRRGLPAPAPPRVPAAGGHAPPRDYKKMIGGVLLAMLFMLIFFSKTIYGYNLPAVTAVKPENGRLSKLEMSSGIADFAEVQNLYAAVGGRVEEVLVEEGDTVAEGQELYRLSFEREEAERKLRELQNSRGKLQTEIDGLHLSLEMQRRYRDDLAGERYEEDVVSTYELDAVNLDIRRARDELRDVRDRYDDGEADEQDVDQARYELQALYLKQEELERKLEEQRKAAADAYAEQLRTQESRLLDYQAEIAALELSLKAKELELSSLFIQEEPYQKALEDFETHAVLTAPTAGTVLSLAAVRGESVHAEQLMACIGAGSAFQVECSVSLDNNFVLPGDSVELSNSARVVQGTVSKLTPTAQSKTVTIALESDEVTAGETFDVTFRKDSDTTYTLVPNGALHQDNDGYFLNQVKRRDGILGQEYYLERLDVYIGDSDDKNTVIVQGILFFEPIALISDKPASAGDVVSLLNAGDFFEK